MSGIVGLLNLDGAPVDAGLLACLVGSLAFRGPDREGTWCDGPVGFGHALLATTSEAWDERQPYTLDGAVWVVADARVDAREDLRRALRGAAQPTSETATDVELILRAYQTWGEDCVDHLIGDFAFAIWDHPARRLFCARDHFGVKPFYYTQCPDYLLFSNTLNTVRLHPDVPDDLNDLAVADFLMFGYNQEPDTTTFTAVQRLPPAHTLCWTPDEGVQVRRYWTLPIDQLIRYKRQEEYIEHFRELFRVAVADRLRTERVGVSMSGGMDSTAVAATTHALLEAEGGSFDLRAYTSVYERLIQDEEGKYATLVADALGIPIHFLVSDDYGLFEPPARAGFRFPEPGATVSAWFLLDQFQAAGSHCRVMLTGYGGDPVLYGAQVVELLGEVPLFSLCIDLARCLFVYHKLPAVGTKKLRQLLGRPRWRPTYPPWFPKELETRLGLPRRWEEKRQDSRSPHPTHPDGYQFTLSGYWPSLFEAYDPGVTSFHQEYRAPFFDLRLVQYALSIPPVPWCVDKLVLREAMRGVLPEQIVDRPKTPLAAEPVSERLRLEENPWGDWLTNAPEIFSHFVDGNVFHSSVYPPEKVNYYEYNLITLPVSLSVWLQTERSLSIMED